MKPISKIILTLSAIAFIATFSGCTKDKCSTTYTYQLYEPVFMEYDQLRAAVASEAPRALKTPGKIYIFNNYLFVNEVNEGVHVIDNSNPAAPVNKAFINIPGNVDIAVRGAVLYADSYIDLVAIDISNPENAAETKRVENLFPQRLWEQGYYYSDPEKGVVVRWDLTSKTENVEVECGQEPQQYYYHYGVMEDGLIMSPPMMAADNGAASFNANVPQSGKGGSMARFAIAANYLYAIDNSDMNLLDISNASSPTIWTKIGIGFNIETIFPYEDKLFIGSTSGMYIYDNSNPSSPVQLSRYDHITSCDPVVVEGDYAYVTLRSGTPCQGFTNQLEVVDISNPSQPSLVKTYQMFNPHGLGIDDGTLFICDGDAGLKVYDASNVLTIDENLIRHFGNIHAYDVIPVNNRQVLIMIGSDGLYQYSYSDLNNVELISRIPVI